LWEEQWPSSYDLIYSLSWLEEECDPEENKGGLSSSHTFACQQIIAFYNQRYYLSEADHIDCVVLPVDSVHDSFKSVIAFLIDSYSGFAAGKRPAKYHTTAQ